jgi:hypothetical protein
MCLMILPFHANVGEDCLVLASRSVYKVETREVRLLPAVCILNCLARSEEAHVTVAKAECMRHSLEAGLLPHGRACYLSHGPTARPSCDSDSVILVREDLFKPLFKAL